MRDMMKNRAYSSKVLIPLCLFLQLARSGAQDENLVSQNQPLPEGKLCLFTCSEWIFQEKILQFAQSAELLGAGQLSKHTIGLPCEDASHSEEGSNLHYKNVWGAVYLISESEYQVILRQSQSENRIAFASKEDVVVPNYADFTCVTFDLGIQSGNHPPRQNPSHKLPNEALDEAYYNQLGNLGVPQDYINGLRNISQKPRDNYYPHIPRDYHPMDNGHTVQPEYNQFPVQNQQSGVLSTGNNGPLGFNRNPVPQQNAQVPLTRSQSPQGNQLHAPGKDVSSAGMLDQPFVEISPIRLTGNDYNRPQFAQSPNYRPVSNNGRIPTDQSQYPQQVGPAVSRISPHSPQPTGPLTVQQPVDYSLLNNGDLSVYSPTQTHQTFGPSQTRDLTPKQPNPQNDQDFVVISPIRLPVANNGRPVVPGQYQPPFNNNEPVVPPRGSAEQGSSEETLPCDEVTPQVEPNYTRLQPNGPRTGSLGFPSHVDNSYPSPQRSGGTFVQPNTPSTVGPDDVAILPTQPGDRSQPFSDREIGPISHPHLFAPSTNRSPQYNGQQRMGPADNSSPESRESQNAPVRVLINPEQTLPLLGSNAPYGQIPVGSQPSGPITDCIGEDSFPVGQPSIVLTNPDNQFGQRPVIPFQQRPVFYDTAPAQYGVQPEGYPQDRFIPNTVGTNSPLVTRPVNPSSNYRTGPQNSPILSFDGTQPNLSLQPSLRQSAPITSQYSPQGVESSPQVYPNDNTQSGVQPPQSEQMFYPDGYPINSVPLPSDGNNQQCTDTPMFIPDNYPSDTRQIPSNESVPLRTNTPEFTPDNYPSNTRQIPSNGNIPLRTNNPAFTPDNYPSNTRQIPLNGNIPLRTNNPAFPPENYPSNTRQIPSNGNTPLRTNNPAFPPDNYPSNTEQIPSNGNVPLRTNTPAFTPDNANILHLPTDHSAMQSPPLLNDHPMFIPDKVQSTQNPTTDASYLPDEQMFFPDNYPQNSQQGVQPHATGLLPESTTIQDTPLENDQVPRSIDTFPVTSTTQPHATGYKPKSALIQDHPQGQIPLNNESTVPPSADASPVISLDQPRTESTSVQGYPQGQIPLEQEQSISPSNSAFPVTSTDQPHATGYIPESTLVQDHPQGPIPSENECSTPLVTNAADQGEETLQRQHNIQSVQQDNISRQSNQLGQDVGYSGGSNYNPSTFIAPNYTPDLPSLGFSLAHNYPQYIQQYSPHFSPSVDCFGPDELIPGFTFGNHCQLY